MSLVALDIGGANLKLADGIGYADSLEFPLWKHPAALSDAIRQLLAAAPSFDRIVATMTGELADCYADKSAGVTAIAQALQIASGERALDIYLTTGALAPPDVAISSPMQTAASNWHALAQFAARYCLQGEGLLIDVGSTTVDLIPLAEGQPATLGNTDLTRLQRSELVYTGIERSPVCAVAQSVELEGRQQPLAQEVFATTLDVYILAGAITEDSNRHDTADSRPRTVEACHTRLARALCADTSELTLAQAQSIAQQISQAQVRLVANGLSQVLSRMPAWPCTVVLSGHGEFLAKQVLRQLGWKPKIVSLTEELGPQVSRCAAAHGLAVLARERLVL